MNKYSILLFAALISFGCNSQEKRNEIKSNQDKQVQSETPKGSWKVNKEFDDQGNLISYDSTYTWSSNQGLDQFSPEEKDSIIHEMQSRFYRHFSGFDLDKGEHMNLFAEDSLFTKRFFNDDFFESEFGEEFMDIDRIHEHMQEMQQQFLEKYQSEFGDDGEDSKDKL